MRLTANHRRRFRPSIAVAQPTQIVHFTKIVFHWPDTQYCSIQPGVFSHLMLHQDSGSRRRPGLSIYIYPGEDRELDSRLIPTCPQHIPSTQQPKITEVGWAALSGFSPSLHALVVPHERYPGIPSGPDGHDSSSRCYGSQNLSLAHPLTESK